jgi:putative transposase
MSARAGSSAGRCATTSTQTWSSTRSAWPSPRRQPANGVIHHSDRGSQYASLAFGATLRESGLLASMGSRGDPFDNAMCESVVSTIKEELTKRRTWKTRDQARLAVFDYIETFYNPRRRHSALGYLSPDEYEKDRIQTLQPVAVH